ncbi:hypothetical protein H4R21_002696 [Coemansia helicoidea]|uniref:Uncharacterized protein n=1 Tax=Coemansia helicoidea TaxID=1286919 RepID=A0ACC1L748_9FUNG|nr:hypothetical protein H4R21_002696 [Coemansia helicoidea]
MPAFTVVSASGRPVAVRPQDSDTLQSVVAAACAQIPNAGDPEAYALLHKGKALTLSSSVRLANLPHGATLTLQRAAAAKAAGRTAQAVKVALQIVGAGRIIDDFAPAATLWEVLVTAEARSKGLLNLTARYSPAEPPRHPPGVLVYQQPALLLLSKTFAGAEQLQATTLRSLGLAGGNVVARLSFKDTLVDVAECKPPSTATPEPPAATVEPSRVLDLQTAVEPAAEVEPLAEDNPQTAENHPPAPTIAQDAVEPPPAPSSAPGAALEARQVRVFAVPPSSVATQAQRTARAEAPSEVDSDDAKILVSVQKARQAVSERGFKSRLDQEAEAQRQRDLFLQQHPTTTVRFRFPDRVQIQATFPSTGYVADLYAFVHDALVDPSHLAALMVQPPLQDLAPQKPLTLVAAQFTPAAVVHVRLAEAAAGRPSTLELLRPTVSALSEPLAPPPAPAALPRDTAPVTAPLEPAATGSGGRPAPEAGAPGPSKPRDGPRMPKWFVAGQRRQ